MSLKWGSVAVVAVIAALLSLAVVINRSDDPQAVAGYRLPWSADAGSPDGSHRGFAVVQGIQQTDPVTGACVSGCSTHNEPGKHYAWDFALPDGTAVLAARSGRVGLVQGNWSPDHCGGVAPIDGAPSGFVVSPFIGVQVNMVTIDHGDGTSALYLHLSEVAPEIMAKAKTGGSVVQGEQIGLSGRTGFTQCQPHLHFQVEKTVRADWSTDSIPIAFTDADVVARTTDGVPVEGESYVSDNVVVDSAAG